MTSAEWSGLSRCACCFLEEGHGPDSSLPSWVVWGTPIRTTWEVSPNLPHVTETRPRGGRGVAPDQHTSDFSASTTEAGGRGELMGSTRPSEYHAVRQGGTPTPAGSPPTSPPPWALAGEACSGLGQSSQGSPRCVSPCRHRPRPVDFPMGASSPWYPVWPPASGEDWPLSGNSSEMFYFILFFL